MKLVVIIYALSFLLSSDLRLVYCVLWAQSLYRTRHLSQDEYAMIRLIFYSR